MKIHKINIKKYQQFEDIELDFTYKSGPKKGQPLEKICLIGQSGTGKTTVLEMIERMIDLLNQYSFHSNPSLFNDDIMEIYGENDLTFECSLDKNIINFSKEEIIFIKNSNKSSSKYYNSIFYKMLSVCLKNSNILLLYFSTDLIDQEYNLFTEDKISTNELGIRKTLGTINEPKKESSGEKLFKEGKLKQINISDNFTEDLWKLLLKDIVEYDNKIKEKGAELIQKGLLSNIKRMQKEIEKWSKLNPNPRIELAEKILNPILKKINLEVDPDVSDTIIKLRSISDKVEIPNHGLSTGTIQLILNTIPLYKLDTKDTLILMDEPERSLFPDIQQGLIPFYQGLSPSSQFIVATHSPFIAASFEPEERFIFYFDENGKVKVKNGVAPMGDDPNDLLKKDFGLKSLMNEHGVEQYRKYVSLRKTADNEEDNEKKKELLKQAREIGEKFDF